MPHAPFPTASSYPLHAILQLMSEKYGEPAMERTGHLHSEASSGVNVSKDEFLQCFFLHPVTLLRLSLILTIHLGSASHLDTEDASTPS